MTREKIFFLIIIFFNIKFNYYSVNNRVDSIINIANIEKNYSKKASYYIELSSIFRNINLDSSIYYANKSVELYKIHSKDKVSDNFFWNKYVNAISELANILYKKGNDNDALLYLNEACKLLESQKINDKNEKFYKTYRNIYLNYASIYCSIGKYDDSREYYLKLYQLDSINRNETGIYDYFSNISTIEYRIGNFEYAEKNLLKVLNFKKEKKIEKGLDILYTNLGNIYMGMGRYPDALNCFFESLKISESKNDISAIASDYNSIGNIYYFQKEYNKALEFYKKFSEVSNQLGSIEGLANSYGNIANVLADLGKLEESIYYYKKGIELLKKTGNKRGLSSLYNNLGQSYNELQKYIEAIEFFNLSLNLKKELNDKAGIAILYSNLSDMYYQLNNFHQSKKYAFLTLEISKEVGSIYDENYAYGLLSDIHEAVGDYKNAFKYFKLYKATNDTIYNKENANSLLNIQEKYQSEKKQLMIDNLEKQSLLDKETISRKIAETEKQKTIIYTFIIGLIIITIFSIFLYRLFVQKKKANVLLEIKNNEITQQKEEILAQRDEIESQRDEITKHRDLVLFQKEEIEDSINYAKRIQEAVLPISNESRAILGEHFILFKPKDIVSGDFYWTTKVDNTLIVTVADCTGHGVPGAFMSMMGISFLNEIVRKKEIVKASDVLNELRKEIINALKQKGESGEQKDGMDISLIAICQEVTSYELQDTKNESENINTLTHKHINTLKCQWAGANNPLYVVSNYELQVNSLESKTSTPQHINTQTHQLYEIKGGKMPIAIYERMDDFTNHELELHEGDMIYLFTDGYADQFGGPKGKKFLYKNFKEMLLSNSYKPMIEQKQILETILTNWIGDGDQIDDITVMGIKI